MARAPMIKPANARTTSALVVGREQVSPNFVRVTIAGEGLGDYEFMGADQWFRLFLPAEPGAIPRTMKAVDTKAMVTYLATPKNRRPIIRNYTTWSYRRDNPRFGAHPELDIDIFVDGKHSGPGATWAMEAEMGSPIAMLDQGRLYAPVEDTSYHLVVGDESALPAILAILRDSPEDWRGLAVIEVADASDIRDLDSPVDAELRWVVRQPGQECGSAASAAVRSADLPEELDYAYLAGPSAMVTELRRYLVGTGLPKDRISFTGYWREQGAM